MTKKEKQIKRFDPNGPGLNNGNFIGLPFTRETASVVIQTVPWDATTSYAAGTSAGPRNILDASLQLDLYLEDDPDCWKKGIYFKNPSKSILKLSRDTRPIAENVINALESGENPGAQDLKTVNKASATVNRWVEKKTSILLGEGKKVGLVGGEHSAPLGFLKALSKRHSSFGILQLDAHCDLRKAYEGFKYSHASIFYNALSIPQISNLVQVGIRDYCDEEAQLAETDERISLFTDQYIKERLFNGYSFSGLVEGIIASLPDEVYVSFDIDVLSPDLCPGTGTPVPGGFSFDQAVFILKKLKESGKKVIGFDLCEVGGKNEWDGNVGARILYRLISLL